MPYVELKLVGKLTREQKEKIVDEFSATLERVAKKPKAATYISIQEFEAANWGAAGKLLG